jgi:hypothetical protein
MSERDLLLMTLDQAFDKRAWHGPNVRAALRGVNANQAFYRPADSRHNIWELVTLLAYWKHIVRRRLTGVRGRVEFARPGRNWFPTPAPTTAEWRAELALLGREHAALREAVAALPLSQLRARSRMIVGAAAHDLYHAGQISLLKRLQDI